MVAWACALGLAALAVPARAAGIPADYAPLVVRPGGLPDEAEFDLGAALERARRERKRLYVYLGADDCRYCRRYEAFLAQHATELTPHFAADWLVVDLRSRLSVRADAVFLRFDGRRRSFAEFQSAIGDERGSVLVYPHVWVLDARARPLMQMPTGTGTFQTVPEQLEILRLEQ
jgi:hypothetical protein